MVEVIVVLIYRLFYVVCFGYFDFLGFGIGILFVSGLWKMEVIEMVARVL